MPRPRPKGHEEHGRMSDQRSAKTAPALPGTRPRSRFAPLVAGCAAALAVSSGCSPAMDPATPLGKRAILDSVNIALSKEDCGQAIAILKPIYNSEQTDNDIREAMAAAYACEATINVFTLIGELAENASEFTGSGFWDFLARRFPSTADDRIVEGAQLAQDALHAIVEPSAVILPSNQYELDSFNPGTLNSVDRTPDANSYLFFVTLAAIGGIESRYGSPDADGKRGTATLPWTSATAVKASGTAQEADGCAYASAIVNFVDSLGGLASATTGSISTTFSSLQTTFKSGIFAACDMGCTVLCGLSSCPTCPATLRNRSSCEGTVTDPASCAAAGITTFMVSSPGVGWDQP